MSGNMFDDPIFGGTTDTAAEAERERKHAAANGERVDGRYGTTFADQPPKPDDPGAAEPADDDADNDRDRHHDHDADQHDDEPTTWEPVDLGPWLRGEIKQPQPSIGAHRSDGLRLIYPGREHAIVGETESGKTWLALACVAGELALGNHVVYIHYEEGDPGSTIERLRMLEVDVAVIANRLRFVAPNRAAPNPSGSRSYWTQSPHWWCTTALTRRCH